VVCIDEFVILPFTLIEEVESPQVFFYSVIAYALRCDFLHNCDGEVAKQRIIKIKRIKMFRWVLSRLSFLQIQQI
jgi:hypothetical protein